MIKLGNNIRFVTRVAAFAIVTSCYWSLFELEALVRRKSPRIDIINKWVPRWARINLKIFGVQVEAHGKYADDGLLYPSQGKNDVGHIFVANHRSGMDIPVILATVAAHVISRHDLATWPLIGRSARRVGTLFVDRASRRSGEGVAMFPEGTAHVGDEVREFRPGAFNAAQRAAAEVVPIGLVYSSDDAYFRQEPFMSHIKRIASLRRLYVSVEIGEPLLPARYENVEIKEVSHKRVQELVERGRARLNCNHNS
jgi:1-acyl-sn-glycerol-3-phosphate acyltransferase